MNMQQIIEQREKDIRQALADYGRHTDKIGVLNDVSDSFIEQLAHDSVYAKQGLRELFSKSPVWDEKLDALVINGTRTHDKDYNRIYELAMHILREPMRAADYETRRTLDLAISYFIQPVVDNSENSIYLNAVKKLAPKAYQPNRKMSKIFRAMCVALGVVDDTAGSQFQRLYAQLADELTSKKISFKLFVSINPAHFITMSNPKGDYRGQCLTSCHSFNSTDYEYNNGCSGYARDKVSIIVFTVDDPTVPETLNNRKVTRQIFAYRPGSGLLLQSRMYNKAGGTSDGEETENSRLYRDLVQRELSMLEDVPNLWKTYASSGEKGYYVKQSYKFGGYPDWTYSSFDGHICFRADCDTDHVEPLLVGESGLCICCGDETRYGLYCDSCKHENEEYCEDCEEYTSNGLTTAYDRQGNRVEVCDSCLADHYIYCDRCNEYHHEDCVTRVGDDYVCDSCLSEYCEQCEECGDWHYRDDMTRVMTETGWEAWVCEDCIDEYFYCPDCGDYRPNRMMTTVYDEDGQERCVCSDCSDDYDSCPECGHSVKTREDGTCPCCGCVVENTEEEAVSA